MENIEHIIIPDRIILKPTLLLTREKHLIKIRNTGKPNVQMRYNLQIMCMQKKVDDNWVNVITQYDFFRNMRIDNIVCKEEKFLNMIKRTEKLNPRCTSVSTFFCRLKEALIYENYDDQGIRTECSYPRYRWGTYSGHKSVLTKPISFYDKNTIKAFKKYDIEITTNLEDTFICRYEAMTQWITMLYMTNAEQDLVIKFTDYIQHNSSAFIELITVHNYDFKSLLSYIFEYLIPFENLRLEESVTLLRDYYSMAKRIGRVVKKYPKYLKSMHDIITSNYNAYKQDYDENKFSMLRKKELEMEGKEYCIITPETPKEIISEGTDLNHCVGSYVEQILKEKIYIFFLRLKKHRDSSLVTLELRGNQITQAKGSYNRPINEDESKFLKSYATKKLLEVKI